MSQEDRVETMAGKLAAYTRRAGVEPRAIVAAYQLAVGQRLAYLEDVFHPDLLHPARTVLILLEDAGCTTREVLIAGALTETEFPQLCVAASKIQKSFGSEVVGLSVGVPQPGTAGDTLLEELLAAPSGTALIAVAERLDHARHLHFREPGLWRPFHTQITNVYLPFSGRVHEGLAYRLARWSAAFERRFLRHR